MIAHPIWFLPSSSSLLCSLKSLFYFIFFLSSSSSFFPKNFYTYSIPLSLFFSLLFSLVEQHVSISKRPGSKMRKYTRLDWKVSLWFVNLHFFVFFVFSFYSTFSGGKSYPPLYTLPSLSILNRIAHPVCGAAPSLLFWPPSSKSGGCLLVVVVVEPEVF